MIFLMGSISHASDNRSAPNVFSSGSTISSSQMNENFNFLASEIREKEVNCDNGETISDAINEGYNSLTIFGTCDGAIMVYMFDPNPFNVSYSQLSNKPISHLIIKGGDPNRASKIINSSGGFTSMVSSKGFLQLFNLTFNDELRASDGSLIDLSEITYEVTTTGKDNRIGAYGNSHLRIEKSTINSEVDISESSLGIIKESTINFPNDTALSVQEVSQVELEDSSTVNGRISVYNKSFLDASESTINCNGVNSCMYINNSEIDLYTVTVNASSVQYSVLDMSFGSKGNLNQTNITADGDTAGINLRVNSNIDLNNSNISTNNGTGMFLNNGSYFYGYESSITRSTGTPTVDMGTFSVFKLGGASSSVADVYCYDTNVNVEIYDDVTSTVTKNSSCDGSGGNSNESGDSNYAMIHTQIANAPEAFAQIGNLKFRYNSTGQNGFIEVKTLDSGENMQVYCSLKRSSWDPGGSNYIENYHNDANYNNSTWNPLIKLWENDAWDGRVTLSSYKVFEGTMFTMGSGGAPPEPKSYRFFANIDGYNNVFIKVEYHE